MITYIIIKMHYYEKNIVDIKDEYSEFMMNIIAPLIYEGIKSMYIKAEKVEKEYDELCKTNIKVKNPGVLKIFQHFLKKIPTLNINLIESELIRIRDNSGHADIFDKLIKAVFKSYIILLTYNASGKQCKLVNEKYHEKIDNKQFIHRIYIESAKQLYNVPHLFYNTNDKLNINEYEMKKNEIDIINIIKKSILDAVRNILPMNEILSEYLKNDYIIETENAKTDRIRKMVINNEEDNIFGGVDYYDEDNMKILNSEEENLNKNLQNLNKIIGGDRQKVGDREEYNDNINNPENIENNPVQNINGAELQREQQEEQIQNQEAINNDIAIINSTNYENKDENLSGGKFQEMLNNSNMTSKLIGYNNIKNDNIKNIDDRDFLNAIFN